MIKTADIPRLIPHRPPFLFVDEIVEVDEHRIVTRTKVDPEWDFFRGHYPQSPIMPGVLVCECCFQAGALLIAQRIGRTNPEGRIPVITRISDARFKRMVHPCDVLITDVTLDDELDGAFYLTGRASVEESLAARVAFACILAGSAASDAPMPAREGAG